MRVVATAGHVDHGKSSLVFALTGTDPDRLAEEKERGLTIDLGFAFTALPSGREIGFVDVPGHVRFLKNMLAGVGAVDAAVLVVAANEGWMPQSEEHLRILELLGMAHGLTVLTKADLVDDDTLELAQLEVADHVASTFLADAPVVVCDSLSGRGLDEVRTALDDLLDRAPAPLGGDRPRLWVDRVFAARGAGTVVTGTLGGGSFSVDQEVVVFPRRRPARIRAIQMSHRSVDRAEPASRVALNLSGIAHDQLHRGDAVVLASQWAETSRVDVAISLLPGWDLPRRARLKAYVGSGEHDAVVRTLEPSGRFARVFLDSALPLAPGDRLVLRDPGPDRTVGGAEVLDAAPTLRTRDAARALALPLGPRLVTSRGWLPTSDLARLAGLDDEAARRLAEDLVRGGVARRAGRFLVEPTVFERVLAGAGAVVDEHHAAAPLEPGPELGAVAARLGVAPDHLRAVLDAAGDRAELVVERGRVRRPGHRASAADDPAARVLLDALAASPFAPPSPEELGIAGEVVRALVREGLVVDLDGVVLSRDALDEARRRVVEAIDEWGAVRVADVRNLLGSTRKYVLPILNHLDALGVTRRQGDERVAGPRAGEVEI